jgi:hypothetical protein
MTTAAARTQSLMTVGDFLEWTEEQADDEVKDLRREMRDLKEALAEQIAEFPPLPQSGR